MNAVNYTELRRNLKAYLDRVHEDREPMIVTRKNNKNVVLVSVDEYNSLVETSYLLSNPSNAVHLYASTEEADRGRVLEHDLIDE